MDIWKPVVPLTKLLGRTLRRRGRGKGINTDLSSEQIKQTNEAVRKCLCQSTLAPACGKASGDF